MAQVTMRDSWRIPRLLSLLLSGALLVVPEITLAQRSPVLPVDEAVQDPEFFLFRARVQAALARQDTLELLRIIAPDILNSLGGDGGREEFRRTWSLTQPQRSQLWAALGLVLALGGRFDGDTTFYAPYTYRGTPGDGFETLAVLGRNVLVRVQPSGSAAAVDTVSFEAVGRWREGHRAFPAAHGWEPVRTSKGRAGWVLERDLRSPIDYRAGFVRRDGQWWLDAFVAGD
jgi:hypothetical protein